MIVHSQIYDGFFNDPDFVRSSLLKEPMNNEVASDGVTHPGIVKIPPFLHNDLLLKLNQIYGPVEINLAFARHSYESMPPPNWAHSDMNMTQYVGLVYLSPVDYPWDGTHFCRHKLTKLETHPENEAQMQTLLQDGGDPKRWLITYTCPSRYNRMFMFNAKHIHAAAYRFGDTRDNSRLVLSVFFNIK